MDTNSQGRPAIFGWRYVPLAVLVLVAGVTASGQLLISGSTEDRVAMRGEPVNAVVFVRREQPSEPAREVVASTTTPEVPAEAPITEPVTKPDPTARAPTIASIVPSGASSSSIVAQPDVDRTADSPKDDQESGQARSDQAVDALLAEASRIVVAHLGDEPSPGEPVIFPVEEAEPVTVVPVVQREVVVLQPDDIRRTTADGSSTVKTNHGSVVEYWNTMPRELVDAIDGGATVRVRELVEGGINVNVSDIQGETALIKAAWNSNAGMVRELLALGADVRLASNKGLTALYTGVVSGNPEVVRQLLDAGAPPNAVTDFGKSPLMASAWSNLPEIALLLMRHGAEPDLQDSQGRSALFYALWDRNEYLAKLLVANGARLNTTDYLGQSAAEIARLRRIDLDQYARLEPLQR